MIITLYNTEVIISDSKTEVINIEEDYTVKQRISDGSYITCIKCNDRVILESYSNNFCLIDKRT